MLCLRLGSTSSSCLHMDLGRGLLANCELCQEEGTILAWLSLKGSHLAPCFKPPWIATEKTEEMRWWGGGGKMFRSGKGTRVLGALVRISRLGILYFFYLQSCLLAPGQTSLINPSILPHRFQAARANQSKVAFLQKTYRLPLRVQLIL